MKRPRFYWGFLVLAIVLVTYGGYSFFYNLGRGNEVPLLGKVFFVVGVVLLLVFLALLLVGFVQRKKNAKKEMLKAEEKVGAPHQSKEDEAAEIETKEEPVEEPREEKKSVAKQDRVPSEEATYVRRESVPRFRGGSAYVKKVGYGPVLRVEEDEILDMRSNTYYRIEGNLVKRLGGGPVYEISGNRIRSAFGGYLYEISGGSVNKVFGGYYASFSGGYLQTFNLAEKYEISGSLSLAQKLAIVAILFGTY